LTTSFRTETCRNKIRVSFTPIQVWLYGFRFIAIAIQVQSYHEPVHGLNNQSAINGHMQSLSFTAAPSKAGLSHRRSAYAGTSRDSCGAQTATKTNTRARTHTQKHAHARAHTYSRVVQIDSLELEDPSPLIPKSSTGHDHQPFTLSQPTYL
jgi:hypothetical protein